MRVFLDANILFSATKSDGAVRKLLAALRSAGHSLVADAYVVNEARRNLEVKFPDSLADFEKVLAEVESPVKASAGLATAVAPELPEKDRPVLAAAIRHGCQILLTGDKTHFGPLYGRTVQGVEILPPASLAQRL